MNKILQHSEDMSNMDGAFSNNKMWNLKKKVMPRIKEPATAKKDANGLLVTNPEMLKLVSYTHLTLPTNREV